MGIPVEVTFRHMPESKSVRRLICEAIEHLERDCEDIRGCTARIELPYHHRYKGSVYRVTIELACSDGPLVVMRIPSADGAFTDLNCIVRDALRELRQLAKERPRPARIARARESRLQGSSSHQVEAGHGS